MVLGEKNIQVPIGKPCLKIKMPVTPCAVHPLTPVSNSYSEASSICCVLQRLTLQRHSQPWSKVCGEHQHRLLIPPSAVSLLQFLHFRHFSSPEF